VIEFEPLREEDLPLVGEWLVQEHVRRWWRDPVEQHLAEYRDAIEGRDPTDLYLILLDSRPIGMIQTYLAADHADWDAIVQAGEGVAGVDLLIGEEELVGRGLGAAILEAFVREIVFARPSTHACIASVEEPNRRSWRAFEKAGFRHVRDVDEHGVPHRLMRLERAPRGA
jgi:aminoglycoside 6'-N-acetyltransferase